MRYIITEEYDGKTVKEYLFSRLGLSHAFVTRLKKRPEGIMLCGAHATVRAILRAGDTLDILYDDTSDDMNENIVPCRMPLDILYEDDDVIVCNKPPHMPTHPSHGHFEDTLANGLAAYFEERGKPFVFRAVNRIDSDTSGAVLVAKHKHAASVLSGQLSRGEIKKRYLAVLRGELPNDSGSIERNIGRARESIIFREIKTDGSGDYALTRYDVLARYESHGSKMTAVLAEPVTGRTHQLRVHFSGEGCPIVGDTLYPVREGAMDGRTDSEDASGNDAPIDRQALHAAALSFLSVSGGERITVTAPVPEDIRGILPVGFEFDYRLK